MRTATKQVTQKPAIDTKLSTVLDGLVVVLNHVAVRNANSNLAISLEEGQEQLLKELGNAVVKHAGVDILFSVKVDIVNSDQTTVNVLGTRFEQVPENVTKWAGRTGIRSCISSRSVEELAPSRNTDQPACLLATPVDTDSDQLEALVSLTTTSFGIEFLRAIHIAIAGSLKQWQMAWALGHQQQQNRDLASIAELISRIETASTPEAACQRFADELEQHLATLGGQLEENAKSLQVFVALADKDGEIDVAAISSSNSAPSRNDTTEFCEAAMRECLSRRKMSVWPASELDRHSLLCHKQFAEHLGIGSVVTLPLHSMDGKLQGVAMATSEFEISDRIHNFLAASGTAIATSMALIGKAKRTKLQKMIDKVFDCFQGNRWATILKAATALVLIGLIPLPYKVGTECEIHPLEKRFVAAPFAGQLKECLVEPGDTVAKDQILARMDEREIRMELAEVEADLHRAMKTRDGHVASHESGEARIAQLETERLAARRDLLQHRSQNLELRSPLDGVVIVGELKRAQGMPLDTGQSLFEIAPLKQLVAELAIPEDDVRYVQPGMNVNVRINSLPFESWNGTIERVHPAAEILDDDNVFVAKVNISDSQGRLKPGMRGHAKVSTVWRPIAWNYLHKPVARMLRWLGW